MKFEENALFDLSIIPLLFAFMRFPQVTEMGAERPK